MSLSIVFARGVCAELDKRGLSGLDALRRAGIAPARLHDLRSRLSVGEAEALFEVALELSQDPGLSLAIGGTAPLHLLQLVGSLLLGDDSLRSALLTLRRFSSLLADDLTWVLEEEREHARLRLSLPAQLAAHRRCVVECALALAARVCGRLLHGTAGLVSAQVAHAAPTYAERYAPLFGCPVYFGQVEDALVVRTADLDRRQPHADNLTRAVFERAAVDLLREHAQALGTTHHVRTVLRYETKLEAFDSTQVARRVGVSLRTLRRYLAAEDASMTELLSEARCWHACRLLRQPHVSIKAIAYDLGFADPSSFHRAFKRWTGLTPGDYATLREGDPRLHILR